MDVFHVVICAPLPTLLVWLLKLYIYTYPQHLHEGYSVCYHASCYKP